MNKINVGRWVAGGIAAGIVMWIVEGLASLLYYQDMQDALQAHGLAVEMSAGTWFFTVLVSMIAGFALVFFYAAARPRFGPGPKTAIIAAVTLWAAGYLLSLIGYGMIGLYERSLLTLWGAVGLVELMLAALLGGWIYRENGAPTA
jgi:hypothetical protein